MRTLQLISSLIISQFLVSHCQADWDLLSLSKKPVALDVRLEVVDPFVEMRSGPGRGYPVFDVVEQGEFVEVLKQRPDWYQIRSSKNRTGWTNVVDLSRTLELSGVPADLPSAGHGDYLLHSWRIGFTTGQFLGDELDDAQKFSINLGYRPLSWLGSEIEFGKTRSEEVSGDFYSVNLLVEPFYQWRIAPYLLLGSGKISLTSQSRFDQAPLGMNDSSYVNYGAGFNCYLGGHFVIRGEYRWYSISADQSKIELEEWKLGFSSFF